MAEETASTDLGLTVTEIVPGTYYMHFTHYSRDPKINTAQAEYYLAEVKKAVQEHPGQKINIINDTKAISKDVLALATKARSFYMEAYALPEIGKVAMVGFSPWLKAFILVLAKVANRTAQTSFFDNKERALEWIQNSPPRG
jgi:hypothetical protein